MREADAVAVLFWIFIDHKGFWDFFGGEFYDFVMIGVREILFGNRGDGSRIGIKNSDDIGDTDILIISNVKIHESYFLTI